MKIRLLFTTLIVLSVMLAHAQKFHFGLKAAPTLAWLKTDTKELESNGLKLGFSYGIMTEVAFNENENYALATGIDVSYRGGKTDYRSGSLTIKNTYKVQYVELPLTLKMKTNEIGAMRYFGQFGAAPGVVLRARGDTKTILGALETETTNENIKSDITAFNVAMIIALGMEYNLTGSTNMLVSLSFNNGFTNLSDVKVNNYDSNGNVTSSTTLKFISNHIALNIGVLF